MFLKKSLIFLFFLLLTTSIFAQKKLIDKLEFSLKNIEEVKQIDIYNELSRLYKNISLEKSYQYAKQALKLAQKYNQPSKILKSKLSIGEYFLDNGNYTKASITFFEVLKKSNKVSDKFIRAGTLNKIGVVFYFQNKCDSALDYLKKSLKIYKKSSKYLREKSQIFNLISYIHNQKGDYSLALEYHFKALDIRKQLGNKNEIAKSYNSIGSFYSKQKDYTSAINYYRKSLNISLEIKSKKGKAISLHNIANVYIEQGLCDKAKKLHYKALRIKKELNLKKEIALSYKSIGRLYVCEESEEKALVSFNKAYVINEILGNYAEMASVNLLIAQTYTKQKQYQLALTKYQQAEKQALQAKALITLSLIYQDLYELYLELEDNENFAFYYKKKQKLISENNLTSINSAKIKTVQKKYEYAEKKKEAEILAQKNEILEKEKKIQSLNIKQKNIFLILLIIVSSGSFIIIYLVYNRFQQRKKANKYLQSVNENITNLNEKLSQSESALLQSNLLKDKFLSIISHDVRSPLTTLSSLVDVLEQDINSLSDKQLEEAIKNISVNTKNALTLLDDLLTWSNAQSQKLNIITEHIEMFEFTKETVSLLLPQANNKSINIHLEISPELKVDIDRNILRTLIFNLLSNAIKFTPQNGSIHIQTEKSNTETVVKVADSGIGMTKEEQDKLFNPNINFTKKGTNQEKGTGVGLIICKEFINLIGGKIWLESEINQGTEFFFTIPDKQEESSQEYLIIKEVL